mmetsp:Transcript_16349/g.45314  ORF Transcript_16349/g.45314 Transcript_16349/m.45314 type:complete len:97 (+) Transcript_16349:184-474(+)
MRQERQSSTDRMDMEWIRSMAAIDDDRRPEHDHEVHFHHHGSSLRSSQINLPYSAIVTVAENYNDDAIVAILASNHCLSLSLSLSRHSRVEHEMGG